MSVLLPSPPPTKHTQHTHTACLHARTHLVQHCGAVAAQVVLEPLQQCLAVLRVPQAHRRLTITRQHHPAAAAGWGGLALGKVKQQDHRKGHLSQQSSGTGDAQAEACMCVSVSSGRSCLSSCLSVFPWLPSQQHETATSTTTHIRCLLSSTHITCR